jgi:hypothetical protein
MVDGGLGPGTTVGLIRNTDIGKKVIGPATGMGEVTEDGGVPLQFPIAVRLFVLPEEVVVVQVSGSIVVVAEAV